MKDPGTRKHAAALRYLESALFGLAAFGTLSLVPFYPLWLQIAMAAAIGLLAVFSAPTAAIVLTVLFGVSVVAADLVIGVFVLIVGLIATQYLADGRALGFLIAVIAALLVPFNLGWAVVAFAGYALGAGQGALAGATAVIAVIAAGVCVGEASLGVVATGAATNGPLAGIAAPEGALSLGWLPSVVNSADPDAAFALLRSIQDPAHALAQIALWAVAGAAGGLARRPRDRVRTLAAIGIAVLVLAAGHIVFDLLFGGPVSVQAYLVATAVSLPVALMLAALGVWVFTAREPAAAAVSAPSTPDVDELLRTIAAAEDQLVSQHRAECVVMITDMKSFSAMTEEVGSVESAKIVQRHRDLLLPIITRHQGHGAPTGGDGLVAAFSTTADALSAAIEMQQALDGYTGSERNPHELAVRIGVASGEVVLDARGCPFLGAALNLAARVMDLADGGRIMTTGPVATASGLPDDQLHPHGDFKLKNIAEPVPVIEVLWRGEPAQEMRAT